MRDTGTLWRPSRTRCVHDAKQISWLSRNRINHIVLAHTSQLRDSQDLELGVGSRKVLHIIGVTKNARIVDNNGLDVGIFQRVRSDFEEVRVDEDGVGLGLNERMLESLFSEGVVGRDDGDGLRSTGMRHGEPIHAVNKTISFVGQ